MSSTWDISTATYLNKSYDVTSEDTTARIKLGDSGSKLYVAGGNTSSIYQYSLSTSWDISTASYNNVSKDVSGQLSTPRGVRFKPDGTIMYVGGGDIYQYSLSTAWDVSTASYSKTFSPSEGISMYAPLFNSDGTSMMAFEYNNQYIYQYSLSTAWDISTASYANKSYNTDNVSTYAKYDVTISDDGKHVYLGQYNPAKIFQLNLSTPWDISTATDSGKTYSVSQTNTIYGLDFGNGGLFLYVIDANEAIYQYSIDEITQPKIKIGSGAIGGNYIAQTYIAGQPKLGEEYIKEFLESVGISDSRIVSTAIKTLDTLNLTEAFARTISLIRSDSVGLTEVFGKIGSFVKSLSDSINLADTYAQVVNFVESFVDNIGITDLLQRVGDFIRSFIDSLTSSDNERKTTSKGAKTENISVSENYSVIQVFLKFFTETVSVLENFATDLDKFFSRLFTEQIKVQDTWGRILDKVVQFSEAVGVADIVSKVLPSLNWSDTISVEDKTFKKTIRGFVESIGLLDVFKKVGSFVKDFTESIVLTEKQIKKSMKNFADNIVESEVFHIIQSLHRSFVEGLEVVDNIAKKIITGFGEAISMIDNYLKMAIKNLTESISISDTIKRAITIVRRTVITVSDSIKRRLNGMLILWEKVKGFVGEWTAREKTSEEYSTIEKDETDVWIARSKKEDTYTSVKKSSDDWTKLKDENDE